MKNNGYYGIGAIGMKTAENYGTLFRTAQILRAAFIFLIGTRFKIQASDTMKSYRHVPLFLYDSFEDFNKHRPYSCPLIGVEIVKEAIPLPLFKHPKRACYLLGAEDTGIPKYVLEKCQDTVKLPGSRSLNVATAGSIVMYDRYNRTGAPWYLNPSSNG